MTDDEGYAERAERWRYGHCYPFALAMAKRFGWEVEALVVDVPHGTGLHLVHVWGVDPDGRRLDAGGSVDVAEVRVEYLSHTGRKWSNARVERFTGEDAYLAKLAEACGEGWWESFRDDALVPMTLAADAFLGEHEARFLPYSGPRP